MSYRHVKNFHKKIQCYSNYNKFRVIQNSLHIIEQLCRINIKKNARKVQHLTSAHFTALYLVFKSSDGNRIGFSLSSVYMKRKSFFIKARLIEAVIFLIKECYFTVGNLILKQDNGIPIGINPDPFR